MNKYILAALMLIIGATAATAKDAKKKEVIIFSQPCYYCEKMKEYVEPNIIPEYPNVEFKVLDIREDANRKLLLKYVKAYNIAGNEVGLPLIFVGGNYIMGWTDEYGNDLRKYIDEYIAEKITRAEIK
ncbi:MAG: hypothetical protein LBL47_02070 [Lactobacillus sp.]|jgi:glutaredoxin|nr:hypothetical protein [Lactobacillus sp.]